MLMDVNGKDALVPYAYKLCEDVIFFVEDKLLLNFNRDNPGMIKLRSTMANLLDYLLRNANNGVILDDELMVAVWENCGLRASSYRLWQVARELRYKLVDVGLDKEIFYRVERKGFLVNSNDLLPLYVVNPYL